MEFTNLIQFFSGYFHQDWVYEADSTNEVVDLFKDNEPKEFVDQVLNELNDLLEEKLSEEQLNKLLLEEFGCYYDPHLDGIKTSDWLMNVRKVLSE